MSGDMSNAELGISGVDAAGAKNRLSDGQLEQQQQWTQNAMSERILGYLLLLCPVALGIVWSINVSNAAKYGITCAIVVTATYWIFRRFQTRAQLLKNRERQVASFNNSD